jgi:hypothetical protein
MKDRRSVLFLAWCLFVITASYATLGSCDLVPVVIPLVMWVGGPLMLFTAMFGLYQLKQQDLAGFRWFGVVAALCFTGIAIHWLGGRFCDWEIQRGKAFVRDHLRQLEAYNSQHHAYPESLAELKLSAPRLLRYWRWKDREGYSFGMEDPRMIWGGWLYESDRKEWFYHD